MSIVSEHIPIGLTGPWIITTGTPTFVLQGGVPIMRFDSSTIDAVKVALILPEDIVLTSNPQVEYKGFPISTQSSGSDFRFDNEYEYIGNGESVTSPPSSEGITTNVTVSDTSGIQFSHTDILDASLMSAGDMLMITLRRDASDVADDRNGDMAIATVKFIYTSSLTG